MPVTEGQAAIRWKQVFTGWCASDCCVQINGLLWESLFLAAFGQSLPKAEEQLHLSCSFHPTPLLVLNSKEQTPVCIVISHWWISGAIPTFANEFPNYQL